MVARLGNIEEERIQLITMGVGIVQKRGKDICSNDFFCRPHIALIAQKYAALALGVVFIFYPFLSEFNVLLKDPVRGLIQ